MTSSAIPKSELRHFKRIAKLRREIALLREKDWRVWRLAILCAVAWMICAIIMFDFVLSFALMHIPFISANAALVLAGILAVGAAFWVRLYSFRFFFWMAAYGAMVIFALILGGGDILRREDIDSIVRVEDSKKKARAKIATAIAKREAIIAKLKGQS